MIAANRLVAVCVARTGNKATTEPQTGDTVLLLDAFPGSCLVTGDRVRLAKPPQ